MNHILQLLAHNKARGSFTVEAKADATEATIYLYDMIVDTDQEAECWSGISPESFIRALNEITAPTIHLRVNSPGGSVFAARAIEQAIRQHSSTIIAHVDGMAASAASFLIMAASEIRMAPGSFLMIHKAWGIAYGNSDDIAKAAGLLEQIDGSLVKTYATRTGQSEADIAGWMAAETWFEADRAVELGFANQVDSGTTANSANNAAPNWDIRAFKNAPQPPKKPAEPPQTQQNSQPPAKPVPDRAALHRAALKAMLPPAPPIPAPNARAQRHSQAV